MLNNILAILIFSSTIFLGFILIVNPLKVNTKANIWLGMFNLVWSTYWLEEVIYLSGALAVSYPFNHILRIAQYSAPFIFFICIKSFTYPDYKVNKNSLFYIGIPYSILIFLELYQNKKLDFIEMTYFIFLCFAYILSSLILLKKHKNKVQKFTSNTREINLSWLEYIIWIVLALIIVVSIYNFTFLDQPLNVLMNIFVLLTILLTAYYSLKQKEIFPKDKVERQETLSAISQKESETSTNQLMSINTLEEYMLKVEKAIRRDELFMDTELNLAKLAKKVDLSPHQLSYVINTGFHQNFNNYINTFRIEKAKKLLESRSLNNYSILGIAYESGFNSKTSFNIMFKKITGTTPSQYKKSCSEL